MPIDKTPVRVQIEFAWANSDEIQDTGFWCMPYPAGSGSVIEWEDAVNAIADRVVDAWVDHMSDGLFGNQISGARCVVFGYAGDLTAKHASDRGEAGFEEDHEWAGTGTSLPPENSVVLSLYGYTPGTYVANRARKRGRMYLPTPATSTMENGQLSTTAQAAYLAAGQSFFNAVTGSLDLGGGSDFYMRPVILSRAPGDDGNAKNYTLVSNLRVGRVIDTQRRRRNRLPENYIQGVINTDD